MNTDTPIPPLVQKAAPLYTTRERQEQAARALELLASPRWALTTWTHKQIQQFWTEARSTR